MLRWGLESRGNSKHKGSTTGPQNTLLFTKEPWEVSDRQVSK